MVHTYFLFFLGTLGTNAHKDLIINHLFSPLSFFALGLLGLWGLRGLFRRRKVSKSPLYFVRGLCKALYLSVLTTKVLKVPKKYKYQVIPI
jgi:hypothetical protein